MIINKAPPTEKQSAASRANGKKSRGPLTAEGKINSALNSTVHGLLARTIVLEGDPTIGSSGSSIASTRNSAPNPPSKSSSSRPWP
jgi:hypothetical protein